MVNSNFLSYNVFGRLFTAFISLIAFLSFFISPAFAFTANEDMSNFSYTATSITFTIGNNNQWVSPPVNGTLVCTSNTFTFSSGSQVGSSSNPTITLTGGNINVSDVNCIINVVDNYGDTFVSNQTFSVTYPIPSPTPTSAVTPTPTLTPTPSLVPTATPTPIPNYCTITATPNTVQANKITPINFIVTEPGYPIGGLGSVDLSGPNFFGSSTLPSGCNYRSLGDSYLHIPFTCSFYGLNNTTIQRSVVTSNNLSVSYYDGDTGVKCATSISISSPPPDQPPSINPLSDTAIYRGNTYSAIGSFTDPDSTSWTASVDYGDGSGLQPLALSGANFSLNHTYSSGGSYSVFVYITDNQGATGLSSVTVNVFDHNACALTISPNTVPSNTNTNISVTVSGLATAPTDDYLDFSSTTGVINLTNVSGGGYNWSPISSSEWKTSSFKGTSLTNFTINATVNPSATGNHYLQFWDYFGNNFCFTPLSTFVPTPTNSPTPTPEPAPSTTATLSPAADNQGNYQNPTTVTLSANAASGFTIANTYYTLDGGSQQTYSSPFTISGNGSHTITYWSVDNSGVTESVNTKTFSLITNLPPVVNPIANTTINEGDTYSASGSFSDSDSSSWTATVDYGDSSGVQPLTLSGFNFSLSHAYETPGTYTLTVSVTDNQGATGTQIATITVNNVVPFVGGISAPTSPVQPNSPVNILANFTDPGTRDTHTASINWGDGSSLSTCPPNSSNCTLAESNGSGSVSGTHAYTTPGTYTITLMVTDSNAAMGTSTIPVIINAPPTANAGGPYTVNEGSDVTLTGSGTDQDGDTLTYAWDLTGGTNFATQGQSVTFHGVDEKTQPVTLQVCDPFGACATSSTTVTISNVNPTVNTISITPSQAQQNQGVTATASFTDPGTLDTHTASWNWGDGNTTTGTVTENNGSGSVSNTHTYSTYGTYTITLTVTDDDGVPVTQTQQLFVNAPPVANAGGPYAVNQGGTVLLSGSATDPDNDTLSYAWDLNNTGSYTVTGQTPLFSSTSVAGTQIINLQVCDNHGACNTSSSTVIINAPPQIAPLSGGSINQRGTYTENGSFTDTDSTSWTGTVDYGDGSGLQVLSLTGKTFTLSHIYTASGSFTETVIVTDNQGAMGVATATVVVNAPPVVNTIPNATSVEASAYSANGSFTDTDSTSWTGTVDYGDGSVSNSLALNADKTFTLSHVYKDEGTYTVNVSIVDNQGASGTGTETVTVTNAPFTISAITAPSSPTAINTAITASVTISDPGVLDTHTAIWSWGDGITSNAADSTPGIISTSHTYTSAGVYTVTVTVTDDDGVSVISQPFQYVVIYNNQGGFFTGSGKYTSQQGWDMLNPNATGEVRFGVSAQYPIGGNTPTGQSKLTFKVGNLTFTSTSYSWLVVNSGKAYLMGTGTIVGSSDTYNLFVTGLDSAQTIRFQLRDNVSQNIIYDTQPGVSEVSDPTTTLTSGSIKVH